MATGTTDSTKWVRRNIIALWDGQPYPSLDDPTGIREKNMAECDRIMIALYRFQTEGRVSYRRIVGMHGGGGGTSSTDFRTILTTKMQQDVKTHYQGKFPDDGYWPNPVPNSPPPVMVGATNPDLCFAYSFCWHSEPQFLLWHRPLMAEFERGLQEYDPKYNPGDTRRFKGSDALGAPYWGWEGWDGLSLPQVVTNPIYVVKTKAWESRGFKKGSCFRNPFYRWLAPVSIEQQKKEYFPDTLTDENTTMRAAAFDDPGVEFAYQWTQVSSPMVPSVKEIVETAMSNPNWNEFCTTKTGSSFSIESAHNKFHNHIGGLILGGTQGPGIQVDPTTKWEFSGTMAANQSIFDPLFWLHHSNVERQFMSWQLRFAGSQTPASIPPKEQMATVLYPWTKPSKLFNGQLSWNTPSSSDNDATFADWWNHTTLPYRYDDYLQPAVTQRSRDITPVPTPGRFADGVRMIVVFDGKDYKGGDYVVWNGKNLVGMISILSAQGGVCARCNNRSVAQLCFEVSEAFPTIEEANAAKDKLALKRNGNKIEIEEVKFSYWNDAQ